MATAAFHKRVRGRFAFYDYVTAGIAGRIMGNCALTFKRLVKRGGIPYQQAHTKAGEVLVKVSDVLKYCIMNNLPYNDSLIEPESLSRVRVSTGEAWLHAIEPALFESKLPDVLSMVNLYQLFKFMAFDPYKPVVIGIVHGVKYANQIIREVRDTHTVWEHGAKAFSPKIIGLIKPSDDAQSYADRMEVDTMFHSIPELTTYLSTLPS